MRSPVPGSGNHPLLHLDWREPHSKDTPFSDLTLHSDATVMPRDQAATYGEAQPGALRGSLRRIERLEDALDLLGRNTAAGVLETDVEVAAIHPRADDELTVPLH